MSLRQQHTTPSVAITADALKPEAPAEKPAPRRTTRTPRTTPATPTKPIPSTTHTGGTTTMSAATETMTATVEKGLAKTVGLMLARVLAPGIVTTLIVQNIVVLPAAMAPAAAWLGLDVR